MFDHDDTIVNASPCDDAATGAFALPADAEAFLADVYADEREVSDAERAADEPPTTRTAPEYRSILSGRDAVGRIDPATTTTAFRRLVADRHGRADFLEVDADGRV